MSEQSQHRRVVIIGSGPAGWTAALYTARAGLKPLVISGYEVGGQLTQTTDVENFPGFPDGMQGPELMQLFEAQALRFETEVDRRNVTAVDFSKRPFTLSVEDDTYTADAVIISTGADARWLGLESEEKLRLNGGGVSACATCDGAFYRDMEVAVVGGGDTALEEAMFLTRFCTKVYLIHRREELRASKIMQKRAQANEKIEFIWNKRVADIKSEPDDFGRDQISALVLEDTKEGGQTELKTQGLFVAIGHKPNTEMFDGVLDVDENGYLLLKEHNMTNVEGVFAAGDVHDHRYRQAITAAGSGCRAAIDVERWLAEQDDA